MFGKAAQQFEKYLQIEKERNLQMLEISRILKVDFTFSEEETIKNAEEQFSKYIERKTIERMEEMLREM
tara:strand:- start:230 stop:436 length:207 start_codon:yes stop_codon:yes gene_type:complete